MSYSLNNECSKCKKFQECVDRDMVMASIYAIHGLGYNRGHKGGGTIKIECSNLVEQEVKAE